MKLLFVIDNLGSGGAQRQMVELAIGLHSNGHQVEIFAYGNDGAFFDVRLKDRIPIHLREKRYRWSLSPAIALRRLIFLETYDLVMAFLHTPAIYTELALLSPGGPPLVVGERGGNAAFELPILLWLRSQLHRRASYLVCNSVAQASELAKRCPWLRNKLKVIHNGVDTNSFSPRKDLLEAARPVGLREVTLLGAGRVNSVKNIVKLVRALSICTVEFGIDCRVIWTGRVDQQQYFEAVNREIVVLGLRERWLWLGEREDVAELMKIVDALILPSIHEGFPNVICEALASGLPVLCSAVGDNSTLIGSNEDRGLLFSPEDPREIASAIERFTRLSEEKRELMSRIGRKYAEEGLSIRSMVDNYERLFDGLIGSKSAEKATSQMREARRRVHE